MEKKEYDAVVVGAGPNGLAAAITLQRHGLSVLLLEAAPTVGGGMRSGPLTLPGFTHDICSAIHPLAVASPFFESLDLGKFGLQFIQPGFAAAHPFDDGTAAVLQGSPEETASGLGADRESYLSFVKGLSADWPSLKNDVLAPLHFPADPAAFAAFGWKGFPSAEWQARRFSGDHARGLWAGMATHAMLPLSFAATSAVGLVLLLAGHHKGWPLAKGGSQSIADALAACFVAGGGEIATSITVRSLKDIPSARAVLFDTNPASLLQIAGHRFSPVYRWQLDRYRYGMGVFKIDWALSGPIPFTNARCREAGTVHLGNTLEEIAAGEQQCWDGQHPEKPFVLLAQPSNFDSTRAPAGKYTAWAYCHVPNGSVKDMTTAIEQQVSRFAPGFRDLILARHTMNTQQMEHYNPNYLGGDINGGSLELSQLFTRPALRFSPYRTSAKGIYLCSSSTPPGGGVHGMCGFHAAKTALDDIFNIHVTG